MTIKENVTMIPTASSRARTRSRRRRTPGRERKSGTPYFNHSLATGGDIAIVASG